jgi:hypothetical protein
VAIAKMFVPVNQLLDPIIGMSIIFIIGIIIYLALAWLCSKDSVRIDDDMEGIF